jgi:hypothetical protein
MSSKIDYPRDAAQIRDMIKDYLRPQADHGAPIDTGGGFGGADLWISFGGIEYFITVKRGNKNP